MKSSTAVETASAMEAASTAMESTSAMAAAALGDCRRGHTKNHERKNCNENYRQGLLHFTRHSFTLSFEGPLPLNRRGHLRWQPTYRPILHPFTPSFEGPLPRGKHLVCPWRVGAP
jgi:hypothetical protein